MLNSTELQAVVRNVLQWAGGYAVAHGLASQDQATAIGGGLVALAAVAWSLWEKQQHKADVALALATPVAPSTPTAPQSQALVNEVRTQV